MTAHEMGTHMDPAALRRAEPFDRAFLDMMIPHHEGAIQMAQIQLERGRNRTVKRLAGRIVDAQTNEIALMHQWRIQWFGVTGHEHHPRANGADRRPRRSLRRVELSCQLGLTA